MSQKFRPRDDVLALVSGEYLVKDAIDASYGFSECIRDMCAEMRGQLDVIAMFTAKREGYGKSQTEQYFARKVAKAMGVWPYEWRRNTVFYDWDEFAPIFNSNVRFLPVNLDEAIEALFSRNSTAAAQKRMVQDLITGRYMSKWVGLCGPNVFWFDPIIRHHKAQWWIHIVHRQRDGSFARAYILHRSENPWPKKQVEWDALGYVEYGPLIPEPQWDVYQAAKHEARVAWLEKVAQGKGMGRYRSRVRGPCSNCQNILPLTNGICKLCARSPQLAEKRKVVVSDTYEADNRHLAPEVQVRRVA